MPLKSLVSIIIILSLSTSGFAAKSTKSKVYQWKDANGNIVVSDQPPKDVPYKVITMKTDSSSKNNRKASAAAPPNKGKTSKNDFNSQFAQAQEHMKEMCRIAKANLDTLKNAAKIGVDDGEGGTRTLTEEERKEKLSTTQKQIEKYCKK